jgi:phytoene dehydrogenase-like protein
VFDIDKLAFVNPKEYVRLETEHGESLSIYTNVDRVEAELLQRAPQDATEIRRFASAVRRFAKFAIPNPNESRPGKWLTALRALPYLPLLRQWSSVSSEEYARRFRHPLLRSFLVGGDLVRLSVVAFGLSLALDEHAFHPEVFAADAT